VCEWRAINDGSIVSPELQVVLGNQDFIHESMHVARRLFHAIDIVLYETHNIVTGITPL
jgi:hypothetical protein